MPKTDGPPYFHTTANADVAVDISPAELEAEGWVYVGAQSTVSADTVLVLVQRWHDRNHDGPWRWCLHELCVQLNREDDDA